MQNVIDLLEGELRQMKACVEGQRGIVATMMAEPIAEFERAIEVLKAYKKPLDKLSH